MSHYQIEITERQTCSQVDRSFLEQAINRILAEQQISHAELSVVLVDDREIHQMNRDFLGHDYPTDVISFSLNTSVENNLCRPQDSVTTASDLQGELIVSVETALREAKSHGWSLQAELLLYVVHGILHLCGYDDLEDEARPAMRTRERELMSIWGYCPTGLES